MCEGRTYNIPIGLEFTELRMSEDLLPCALFVSAVTGTLLVQSLRSFIKSLQTPVVTSLVVYPIKSCKGIKVQVANVTKRGLEFDRLFMLVDSTKGKFVSQRKYPRMALIEPSLDLATRTLHIDAPEMPRLSVPLDESDAHAQDSASTVTVWGEECTANEVGGEEARAWFNRFLGAEDLQLVRMRDDCVRPTDDKYAPQGQTSFADGFPFLLVSEGSLDALNARLAVPVTMEHFRPNIVVDRCAAFAEDTWRKIRFVSKVRSWDAEIVKPCARCTMPNVDPTIGAFREDKEPTNTLKTFRTGQLVEKENPKWSGELFFGQNVDHCSQEGLSLAVGDELHILTTR